MVTSVCSTVYINISCPSFRKFNLSQSLQHSTPPQPCGCVLLAFPNLQTSSSSHSRAGISPGTHPGPDEMLSNDPTTVRRCLVGNARVGLSSEWQNDAILLIKLTCRSFQCIKCTSQQCFSSPLVHSTVINQSSCWNPVGCHSPDSTVCQIPLAFLDHPLPLLQSLEVRCRLMTDLPCLFLPCLQIPLSQAGES